MTTTNLLQETPRTSIESTPVTPASIKTDDGTPATNPQEDARYLSDRLARWLASVALSSGSADERRDAAA